MSMIVCYSQCWPCNFDSHFDPHQPHTWVDDEDLESADPALRALSAADLIERRPCGCSCARPAGATT